jgi:pSer/pThr/pTyr-binding forkhead associated (FHA) protein
MAKLVLSHGGALIGEYPLQKKVVTIGRKQGNDVRIDNLAVSSQHARVILAGHVYVLEDLGSTNGTFVNTKKVKRKALVNGDQITVGKHSLKFVSDVARSESEEQETVFLTPSSPGSGGVHEVHAAAGYHTRSKKSKGGLIWVLLALVAVFGVLIALQVMGVL